MNVLIIPDKFKGSLTVGQVIEAIKQGLIDVSSDIKTHEIIASDGGDGFLDAVSHYSPVEKITLSTVDPLNRPIESYYLFDKNSATAYVEMATSSGLLLLKEEEKNPLLTSTFGTGLQIRHAIENGAKKIFVGLGGSGTNDGGTGIAEALGYTFHDETGSKLNMNGAHLNNIISIIYSNILSTLDDVDIYAVNDVMNPLYGAEGATFVYGPQKGASSGMLTNLDNGLRNLSDVVKKELQIEAHNSPGAGAAGGAGYGLNVFCNASFISGIDFVLNLSGVEDLLAGNKIDYIITGEGKIDDQTAYGKLVHGVSKIGKKYNVPVLAICGALQLKHKSVKDLGLKKVLQIAQPEHTIEYLMTNAADLVRKRIPELITGLA